MREDEQAILRNAIREAIITREDKQAICDALLLALKKTRHLYDLISLKYTKMDDDEIVVAEFENGYKKEICVNLDSGIAMIADIATKIL
ncbi:hypothetical protein [Absicoccus intestinalis]|uniref:Uncharacterized protein n=1 Tax=Absicoccus intestinalis TaxID=2926319 RepID=A0ABU4WJ57_9FIRM|nr:hypothetical protein [Absicoccus sp. CLA-KB-P134]MDX8416585.1 hypothetical protein [Absicoccus sp. CLA-KB-P134]